jgi:probable HAF family extracellular repeat protein
MWFRSLLEALRPRSADARRQWGRCDGVKRSRPATRLQLEPLEPRSLLSRYTWEYLGTFGGTSASPADINNAGQIVGSINGQDFRAFLWDNGVVTDLGTLGGSSSRAAAINDRGQVTGWANTAGNAIHGFLITPEDTNGDGKPDRWYRDTNADGANDLMRDLGALSASGANYPGDVNNAGQVVGCEYFANGTWHAFLWQNGAMTELGGLDTGLNNTASAINDAGQVVGTAWNTNHVAQYGFLWKDGVMTNLGVGQATDINSSGQVLFTARLWTPSTPNGTTGTFTSLPQFPGDTWSSAGRINNAGQAVGASYFWNDETVQIFAHGVIWEGAMPQDLGQLSGYGSGYVSSGVAINEAGEIVGTSGSGVFVLIPLSGPFITIGDATVTEGNTGTHAATFTVTLSTPSSQPVSVTYATADDTAAAGSDYQATGGTLTFAPGETSKTISVPIIGDGLVESTEAFFLNLSGASSGTIDDGWGVGTILDDEPAIFVPPFVGVPEGNSGTTLLAVTVTLRSVSDGPVYVDYSTADLTDDEQYWYGPGATAGVDYQATTGRLTFAPGDTSETIYVPIIGDRVREPDELFWVNLSDRSQWLAAILDDEPTVSIDSPAAVVEGNAGTTALNFTVRLSAPSEVPVTVTYATADGSATAPGDYQAKTGSVTFAPGETSKLVTVLVNGDRLGEGDEWFYVNLTGADGAGISSGTGTGMIRDDEPYLSNSDVTKKEGRKGQTTLFVFTVTLSAAYDEPVTISFRTVDGTAKASDNDYVAKSGTLTFAPGETTKTITIEVKGDNKREANESFYLDLFAGSNSYSLFFINRGIGTILNDD